MRFGINPLLTDPSLPNTRSNRTNDRRDIGHQHPGGTTPAYRRLQKLLLRIRTRHGTGEPSLMIMNPICPLGASVSRYASPLGNFFFTGMDSSTVPGALAYLSIALTHQEHRLHHFQHPHEVPMPRIAHNRLGARPRGMDDLRDTRPSVGAITATLASYISVQIGLAVAARKSQSTPLPRNTGPVQP